MRPNSVSSSPRGNRSTGQPGAEPVAGVGVPLPDDTDVVASVVGVDVGLGVAVEAVTTTAPCIAA
jgi:hypothetical protein